MKEQDREEWDMISLLINQDGGFITASKTLQGAQAAETGNSTWLENMKHFTGVGRQPTFGT